MKKLLLRNYVYYFLLILSISLIFQSCTDNNNIEVQEQKKNNLVVESVSFSEIEDNAAINKVFLNHGSKSRINKSSDTSKESESYEILINEISKASYKDYEAYTFRIDNPDQPPFTFDNYVIRKKHASNDQLGIQQEHKTTPTNVIKERCIQWPGWHPTRA